MRFEIIEIELNSNTQHTITADEVVASHIRDVGYKTFLVLVVKRE